MNERAEGIAADYVIVGSGSAGGVMAARLSEDPNCRVILIEAGEERDSLLVRVPAGVFRLIGNPSVDWCRMGEPDASIDGRSLMFPAGKLVGGSSAINGLVYSRGSRLDFTRWETAGAQGWGYDRVLPYFLRSEGFRGPRSLEHGSNGPMGVSPPKLHPLAKLFLAGSAASGMPHRDDYCAGDLDGAFGVHGTIDRGTRASSYSAYLKPARRRPNLEILTSALAERVEFTGRKATGVLVRRDGKTFFVEARREVIVAAGTFGSPLLLQRSGIGPAAVLKAAGVVPMLDVPAVGANLQDHLANGITRFVDADSFNALARPGQAALAGLQWLLRGRGPLASASVQAMAYGRSSSGVGEPDFMLSFLPLCVDFSTGRPALHRRQGVYIATNVCRPYAQGSVTIRTADAGDAPTIQMPLLDDSRDARLLIHSMKIIERVFAQGFGGVISDSQEESLPVDDAGWMTWIKARTTLGYHSVGTCRMGGVDAVLDPQLRVRGTERLRVADASVMPAIISGNTNAAVVMIGERAVDIIKGADTSV